MTQKRPHKIFGTDGIRGLVNKFPMTVELALALGRATAHYFRNKDDLNVQKRPKIVMGKDTRVSGYMIENALAAGILSQGVDVLLVGPLPTPGIAFITSLLGASAGLVISASHNPFHDNGIKIFGGDGFKLPDAFEEEIENLLNNPQILDESRPDSTQLGKAIRINDAVKIYVQHLEDIFPEKLDLSGFKIVLDCANGAAYKAAPALFKSLGAEVKLLGANPDGFNINENVGSLYPKVCAEKVLALNADIGLSLDGDADRVIFIDHKGFEIDGDKIMYLCAKALNDKGKLKHSTLVATVMSNMGMEKALNDVGISVVRTQVGDRYVVEEMQQNGYNFGGEQSGHLIFLDYSTTGDGLLAALQVLFILKKTGKTLNELTSLVTPWPQITMNIPIDRRINLNDFPQIQNQITKVEKSLAKNGRLLIRLSGTEPLIRVMLEGPDESLLNDLLDETVEVIRKAVL